MTNYGFGVNASTDRTEQIIENYSWFVEVSLSEFGTQFGIPADIENAVLFEVLASAMDDVNSSLADYMAEQDAAGFETIEAVPAQKLSGVSVKVQQYKRAVYALAKSELIKNNLSIALKADAESSAKTSDGLAAYYQRMSTKAIARIQDKVAVGVHVI